MSSISDSWAAYLDPEEVLLWQGNPAPGIRNTALLVLIAIFGVPFLLAGLGIFYTGASQIVAAHKAMDVLLGVFLGCFAVPFAGAGAAMMFGPVYMSATAHKKVRYALTNRSAYIGKSYWNRSLETYPITRESPLELHKGRATDSVFFYSRNNRDSDSNAPTRAAFSDIPDGERVYALLRQIQRDQP